MVPKPADDRSDDRLEAVQNLLKSRGQDDMTLDINLLSEIYTNLKTSNHAGLEALASANTDGFLNCLPGLLETASVLTGWNWRDAAMDWTGGGFVNAYEVFSMACTINDAVARIRGSAGECTMYECGDQIAQNLDVAADELTRRGTVDGARDKRHQARGIREMIAQRYAKYML